MKNYEAMFIFSPTLNEEKLQEEIKNIEKTIKTNGKGEVKFDNLGKKTLAYSIKKFNEAVYVNYKFSAQPLAISKIKEALKHKDSILRFIIFVKGKRQ